MTVGTSPKVIAQALATIIAFLFTYLGVQLPTDVSFSLAVLVGWLAGRRASPGEVVQDVGPASDDLLLANLTGAPQRLLADELKDTTGHR